MLQNGTEIQIPGIYYAKDHHGSLRISIRLGLEKWNCRYAENEGKPGFMEILQTKELVVPLYQIMLLLSISTVALLFGKAKLALIMNYLFTLYWGYGFNREYLIGPRIEELNMFTIAYFGFGIIIVVLVLIAFIRGPHR
jgi:hypothetical protein